jgi:hypothetical protein
VMPLLECTLFVFLVAPELVPLNVLLDHHH